ncbi:MAG: hypothetical protein ACI4UV_09690 [Victivallales bacterium]
MLKTAKNVFLFFCVLGCLYGDEPKTQTLRLVQDDAQDYMVSKIYVLKYVQANDITPFVMSIVKRYNNNSIVNCIEYGNNNEQILTVTCPVGMMPYVDDFIKMVDRNVEIDGKVPGDIIKGTGITRAVYRPKYRSGQDLINVIVNAVIGEGPYGSVYGYDQNSNQIYWKDNSSNTEYMFQFLGWLDRPAPQITFHFNIYEVRESSMRDLGIDYLAWKNGPGLNIFQTGWDVFSLSSGGTAALQAMSGPAGGFLFAPQFDASFIRVLQQSGNANIRNTANLTVSNSDSKSYELLFNPQLQNIKKADNDKTSVTLSSISSLPTGANQVYLKIINPVVNMHAGIPQEGYPENEAFSLKNYTPGAYTKLPGTLFFGYNVQTASVVERNNIGTELIETSTMQGNTLIELNKEIVLAQWDKEQDVEQTIGVPFLSSVPILKYLFSTTTTSREKTRFYMTVSAELLNTAPPKGIEVGTLKKVK